ncbi:MAG: response regulator [Acetivibrionales bacterium]|jgi:putative two-component system response regulator
MLSGKKVMIIDDSYADRREIKSILENEGASVVEVTNGLGMHSLMEEYGEYVHLIIINIKLKHDNGFDLIQALKASRKYVEIPVMILSEFANKESVLKAKELEVSGYLKKPVQKDELMSRVNRILAENQQKPALE